MAANFELSRFLQTFVAEARERLTRFEQRLVGLEHDSFNVEVFNELLREAHTLKGSARMIGLMKIDALAHRIEEVLQALRDAGEQPTRQAVDILLEGADALKALVEEAAGGPTAADATDLLNRMARWAGQSVQAAFPIEHRVQPIDPQMGETRAESRAQRVAGAESTVRVEVAKLEKLSNISLDLISACEQVLRADDGLGQLLQDGQAMRRALSELSVRLEVADKSPARIASIARDLAAAAGRQREIVDQLAAMRQTFQSDSHRTTLVTDELRELALDLHMLPISTVFDAFPRAVRDLAAEYDREVHFVIEGAEAKLDKKIIEEIGEPLLHLLRNAVVHGIEDPAERERAGKPRRGSVQITAATRANHIVIIVRDDGRGMDVDALKAKAIERGAIDAAAAERLTREQALELAFLPGVSTTRMITDVSGRGVGMDVVRAVTRRLNGTVAIASHPGAGCTVTLELPLTLAIMHVLLVSAAGCGMAMPGSFVHAITSCFCDDGDIPRTFTVDGEAYPLVSLAGLMELGRGNGNGRPHQIVAVRAAGETLGFVTDDVIDEREVILRPLGPHFARQRKVMAATLLAEGVVVPVLDVPGLMEAAKVHEALPLTAVVPEARPAVLLVEDSLVTADVERSILERAGYEVEVAGDGLEALARLSQRTFDLIVADLEMPRMDGFTLLERLRGSDAHAQLPVVIVTSRQSREDKRRGLALGASAYITKGTFDQDALLVTIARLIG